jgi:hypothetical protein
MNAMPASVAIAGFQEPDRALFVMICHLLDEACDCLIDDLIYRGRIRLK